MRNPLRNLAGRALSALGRCDAELSLLITGDEEIRALNRDWRGKDRATDVLSFPVEGAFAFAEVAADKSAGRPSHVAMGDVVISIDTAEEQAVRLGVPIEEEMARLLVHGILHLAGHDHEASCAAAREMRRLEDRLLAGLPPSGGIVRSKA
jgi:probable rRNA maturation factor